MLVEQLREVKQNAGDTRAKSESGDETKVDVKQDVVILYESNVDGSAEALSDQTPKPRPPNQYVETIVYEEEESESECSDISEMYTKEDLNELCLVNSEALDFINYIPSVDTPLCHKQNKMKLKPSGFVTDYKQHHFENIYFHKNNFNSIGSLLSTSLMDILCFNQKNDNFFCYMDNLISHVQYTIDELKRISNGEYLSERTKEKWLENVKPLTFTTISNGCENYEKVKAASKKILSQPLIDSNKKDKEKEKHSALKNLITVHSEINIKLLNKILGKKVIVKVPKKLYNLVSHAELAKERFMLEDKTSNCRDEISRMIITSNIRYPIFTLSSRNFNIAISTQNVNLAMLVSEKSAKTDNKLLAIKYEQNESKLEEKRNVTDADVEYYQTHENDKKQGFVAEECTDNDDDINLDNFDSFESELNPIVCKNSLYSCKESVATLFTDVSITSIEKLSVEKYSSTSSSLGCSIQQINSKLYFNIKIDENLKVKKKSSPTTIKIKSPYENNSHVFEERKRKKLLKIRERRNKTRNTLSQNKENTCQDLRLETKLLLTGECSIASNGKEKRKRTKKKKNKFTTLKDTQSYMENKTPFCPNSGNPIIINSFSQYLEPLVSQQDFNIKTNYSINTTRTDSENENLNIVDNQGDDELTTFVRKELYSQDKNNSNDVEDCVQSKFNHSIPPVNTPTGSHHEPLKSLLSKECKNSIDKLCSLITDLVVTNNSVPANFHKKGAVNEFTTGYNKTNKIKNSAVTPSMLGDACKPNTKDEISTLEQAIENLPSGHSGDTNKKKIEIVAHMPKVTLSPDVKTVKYDTTVRNRRKRDVPQPDNTLTSISQVLHKIDNVQKYHKPASKDQRNASKNDGELEKTTYETCIKTKTNNETKRNTSEPIKEANSRKNRVLLVSPNHLKSDRAIKENSHITELLISNEKMLTATTQTEKQKSLEVRKKEDNPKISKSIEVKEAVGKRCQERTRLDALAQPKKIHGITTASTRPQRNASLIPQRIKNGVQNKTPHFTSNKLPQESARTQEVTETRPLTKCSERKRVSENVQQTKNHNVTNTPLSYWNKSVVANTFGFTKRQLFSPKRKDLKNLQKPTASSISEQDDLDAPIAKSGAIAANNINDDVNKNLVHVLTPTKANNDRDAVSPLIPDLINTAACLNQSKSDEIISGSDYKIDVIEDGNISTAVANNFARSHYVNSRIVYRKHNIINFQNRNSCSLTKLEKLLTCPANVKTIRDEKRYKDLSPKRSFQQIFVLQSGDTGSLTMKSILKHNTNSLNTTPNVSFHYFTKSSTDWSAKSLSLPYFPAIHCMEYYKSFNTLEASTKDTIDKLTCKTLPIASNIDIWHDLGEVSKYVGNKNTENNSESILESTMQRETVSILNDITDPLQNSVTNADSILTSQTCNKKSSMDILVELINEIKTISTYHANVVANGHIEVADGYMKRDTSSKPLPISELDTLRKFESNSSVHTYFENDEFVNNEFGHPDEDDKNKRELIENTLMDKQVYACIDEKAVINRCTDVPSQLIPVYHKGIAVSTSSTSLNKTVNLTNTEVFDSKDEIKEKSNKNNSQSESTGTIIVDQHLKLKRDILVTFYSLLVLTVFIALTYPDIVARI